MQIKHVMWSDVALINTKLWCTDICAVTVERMRKSLAFWGFKAPTKQVVKNIQYVANSVSFTLHKHLPSKILICRYIHRIFNLSWKVSTFINLKFFRRHCSIFNMFPLYLPQVLWPIKMSFKYICTWWPVLEHFFVCTIINLISSSKNQWNQLE